MKNIQSITAAQFVSNNPTRSKSTTPQYLHLLEQKRNSTPNISPLPHFTPATYSQSTTTLSQQNELSSLLRLDTKATLTPQERLIQLPSWITTIKSSKSSLHDIIYALQSIFDLLDSRYSSIQTQTELNAQFTTDIITNCFNDIETASHDLHALSNGSVYVFTKSIQLGLINALFDCFDHCNQPMTDVTIVSDTAFSKPLRTFMNSYSYHQNRLIEERISQNSTSINFSTIIPCDHKYHHQTQTESDSIFYEFEHFDLSPDQFPKTETLKQAVNVKVQHLIVNILHLFLTHQIYTDLVKPGLLELMINFIQTKQSMHQSAMLLLGDLTITLQSYIQASPSFAIDILNSKLLDILIKDERLYSTIQRNFEIGFTPFHFLFQSIYSGVAITLSQHSAVQADNMVNDDHMNDTNAINNNQSTSQKPILPIENLLKFLPFVRSSIIHAEDVNLLPSILLQYTNQSPSTFKRLFHPEIIQALCYLITGLQHEPYHSQSLIILTSFLLLSTTTKHHLQIIYDYGLISLIMSLFEQELVKQDEEELYLTTNELLSKPVPKLLSIILHKSSTFQLIKYGVVEELSNLYDNASVMIQQQLAEFVQQSLVLQNNQTIHKKSPNLSKLAKFDQQYQLLQCLFEDLFYNHSNLFKPCHSI